MSCGAVRVSWHAGGKLIVDKVSLQVEPGAMLGVLGPNGSGKTSLLRMLAGLRRPSGGAVMLDGTDLSRIPRRDLARRLAVVEQQVSTDIDLTVAEVVALGRTPHRRGWAAVGDAHDEVVTEALERTGLTALASRSWHSLSGGERQRTQIARALAQQPTELLLDEPTNHLDIQHQLGLLDLVQQLDVTSVVVLHDLNLAARHCCQVLVMNDGKVVAGGEAADVLTEELIAQVWGVKSEVTMFDERPHIRYLQASTMARSRP